MIVFDLACPSNHVFEGWFASAEDFVAQRERSLVRCPVCDDSGVVKRPSAVSFKRSAESRPAADPLPGAQSGAADSPPPELPQMGAIEREVLERIREYVRRTEDVGTRFAEEARRIHYDEVPRRNIRGRATAEQAQELRDEGIEFHSLPTIFTDEIH